MSQPMKSKTLSISIAAAPDRVYAFVSNPENLPKWAHGLGSSVMRAEDAWIVQTRLGPVTLQFVAPNTLGVLDHRVCLPQGLEITNPMRVVPNGDGSEILFTLFHTANLSDAQFASDAKLVKNDLRTLKRLLETQAGS